MREEGADIFLDYHAFIVATHIDKAHIHNHIIYNSTSVDCSRKFNNFFLSGLAVQKLCEAIDSVLKEKPKSFENFVQALADMGFEFKDGKQPAFKGKDQKRFIRLRSLGEGYSKKF